MNYNPEDIIPGHVLIVTILASFAIALFVALLTIIIVRVARKKVKRAKLAKKGIYISKYPLLQKVLYKTKFNYSICKKDSNDKIYLIKVTYLCFDRLITYYISVPKQDNYLSLAKQQVIKSIKNDTLCVYTLKVIACSYKEFKYYATY